MTIPFIKAHGAQNDFLLSWRAGVPPCDLRAAAVAICARHTGIGADGWMLVDPPPEAAPGCHGRIQLLNCDGSDSEISGNGTRCAAALLIESGYANDAVSIETGAGVKQLRLISRDGSRFQFEMGMGAPRYREEELRLPLTTGTVTRETAVLNVGNPQCVIFVADFDFDWRGEGAAWERHPQFPQRTNVSFVKILDRHTIDVRFFERGAGETMSSGTGSTGAAAAAVLRGLVSFPVTVQTPAGPLALRSEGGEILLAGPAELIGRGEFYFTPDEAKSAA